MPGEIREPLGEEVVRLDGFYALREEIEAAQKRLLAALRDRAEQRPENPEVAVAEARDATGLEARLADALLEKLSGAGEVVVVDSGVALPGTGGVPPELEAEAGALLGELEGSGTEPPTIAETPAARLLQKRGEAVRLGEGLLASRHVAAGVLEDVVAAAREGEGLTLAAFRDRLGTSRKYAQAWLEHADAEGVTRRVGDARVLTRRYRQ
jgi:selenocysteine-specific elongation factor